VQEDAGPLMRPYHLVVAPAIDHDNGDVGARPGEPSIP